LAVFASDAGQRRERVHVGRHLPDDAHQDLRHGDQRLRLLPEAQPVENLRLELRGVVAASARASG
jgi:hypothetical protein